MADTIDELAAQAGVAWFDYQVEVLEALRGQDPASLRALLHYRTGAGKSLTALAIVAQAGGERAVVIAPPSTHDTWVATGAKLGVEVECMSHAKFRQANTKLSRDVAVIADEFHLFGGHTGKGWVKFDRLAAGLRAPVIECSATPNYNDAERVYCIQHSLDPQSCKGGFLAFLYAHCNTVQNRYSMTPDVEGFKNFPDAAAYLESLPYVFYVPDTVTYTIEEKYIPNVVTQEFVDFNYNPRRRRIMASRIEKDHAVIDHSLISDKASLHPWVLDEILKITRTAKKPVLLYANHATVAQAIARSFSERDLDFRLVTGASSTKEKARKIQEFRAGTVPFLIGTASLATGTDGLDKVSDMLIIVDDTSDDSLRRQLIGRIMPRGEDSDASNKRVIRLNIL